MFDSNKTNKFIMIKINTLFCKTEKNNRKKTSVALAIAPNGAIFIGDYNKIRRLSPDLLHLETVLEIE